MMFGNKAQYRQKGLSPDGSALDGLGVHRISEVRKIGGGTKPDGSGRRV